MGAKHIKKRKEKYGFMFWYRLFDDRDLITHKDLRAEVEATGVPKGNGIIAAAVKDGYLDKSELANEYSLNAGMVEFYKNSGEKVAPRAFGS